MSGRATTVPHVPVSLPAAVMARVRRVIGWSKRQAGRCVRLVSRVLGRHREFNRQVVTSVADLNSRTHHLEAAFLRHTALLEELESTLEWQHTAVTQQGRSPAARSSSISLASTSARMR